MDVGLDEIIKKKWKKSLPGRRNRSVPRNRGGRRQDNKKTRPLPASGGVTKASIIDARAKIIARKRKTLRDAREKLNALHRQKDARLRLSSNPATTSLGSRLGAVGAAVLGDMVPRRTINNASRHPRPVMDSFPYERASAPRRDRIYRTIENDDEPLWDPASLPQLEVRLTRPTPAPYRPTRELRTSREDTWLKTAPIIRRNDESVKSRLEPLRQEEGFRIVVSNLQPTVTHEDIKVLKGLEIMLHVRWHFLPHIQEEDWRKKAYWYIDWMHRSQVMGQNELFEDIGPLIGSRVVRPGTAEVVYRNLKDAVAAVDTYHNRQLDGQPMKCLLVNPSASGSKGMVGTKGAVVPDLSTIHKALFMK